ncbi:hypothetical protein OYT88_14530 [Sporolactobacillus sp. CQH2019]|uniref:hypothetical protein n=1 Tax=Sporolactobacillus sp. CQH2019 TaxID=3023512 RepID=UPI002367A606|nr:hypothetical protein [Sporolactobacillus sp. CQH2019]MDD9149768.1 hypothetical protein [Sporolactobacillus sp. CQH2019]
MNGQMYQICCITAAVKKALKEKSVLSYTPLKYENRVEFQFLPEKKLFSTKKYKAEDASAWYKYCLKKGLRDIKFLAPVAVQDRNLLGFSNTTQSSIVCFYRGSKVTYFTANWEFDSAQKAWNILYTEQEWNKAPKGKPHFENNSDSFKSVLTEIKEFAQRIDCDSFAEVFQKALDILLGSTDYTDIKYNRPLPGIPKQNLHLFEAASTADVFGAMGSWNDSPPYMAYKKGMDKEYDSLSAELLKQVRLAMLYAINEW